MAEAGAWAGAGVGAAWIASQVEMRSVDGRTGWTSPFACGISSSAECRSPPTRCYSAVRSPHQREGTTRLDQPESANVT